MTVTFHFPEHWDYFKELGLNQAQAKSVAEMAKFFVPPGIGLVLVKGPKKYIGATVSHIDFSQGDFSKKDMALIIETERADAARLFSILLKNALLGAGFGPSLPSPGPAA